MMGTSSIRNEVYEESTITNKYDNIADREHEVVDLRKKLKDAFDTNRIFCSFELTRRKNTDFYKSFFTEMNNYKPLFYALTSHAKVEEKEDSISADILKIVPKNTLLHLVADNLTYSDATVILKHALHHRIINIFVLRGDSQDRKSRDFPHAVDLVRFIRKLYGDIFCICVAGYPEMHPESSSKGMDLFYLKEKVDAGADFIITQIIFDAKSFIQFVNDCKISGMNVPIIPGIFPISSYMRFERVQRICNIKIPEDIVNNLERIKNNDDKVYRYGLQLSVNIINDIIASKTTYGFHFFTFNGISMPSEICNRLGIFHGSSNKAVKIHNN